MALFLEASFYLAVKWAQQSFIIGMLKGLDDMKCNNIPRILSNGLATLSSQPRKAPNQRQRVDKDMGSEGGWPGLCFILIV